MSTLEGRGAFSAQKPSSWVQLRQWWRLRERLVVTTLSGGLILIGWLGKYAGMSQSLSNWIMIIAAVIAGYRIASSAVLALRFKILGINALVTFAAIGAIIIGEYWEAAVVTFLFAFGSYLEARTMDKTRDALRKLMDLAPQLATVRRDGQELVIPADEVEPGELVIVRPGEKIPVDGKVIKGQAAVNQAVITGESMPEEKTVGSGVFSGTINEAGYLEIDTERSGEDTTFFRIIELVEEAQGEKARTQQLLERFARYYTPGIIVVSLLSYLVTKNAMLALTLLVVACPGALVIATPVSIVASIGNAARHGVLIKGGEHMERAGKIQIVVLDKTGTLTEGRPQVTGYWSKLDDKDAMLVQAAAVEKLSEHPLGRPIVALAAEKADIPVAHDFEVFPGHGVAGTVDGTRIIVGNRKLMADQGVTVSDEIEARMVAEESAGRTAMLVARAREVIGTIYVADVPREDAYTLVSRLKQAGVEKVIMLTGDNKRTAKSVADQLGIDKFWAEALPEDKLQVIKSLKEQGKIVAMVGDGINDAPAMAMADVGIAMGAAGTDVAVETADLVLMADRLERLPWAVGLSRQTLRNIKENVVFAVAIVFILLAGVMGSLVVLASGMLVHQASVLAVIFNAMRLLNYKGTPVSSET